VQENIERGAPQSFKPAIALAVPDLADQFATFEGTTSCAVAVRYLTRRCPGTYMIITVVLQLQVITEIFVIAATPPNWVRKMVTAFTIGTRQETGDVPPDFIIVLSLIRCSLDN